jgi:hypothetical protein
MTAVFALLLVFAADVDHDGLDDALEARLLAQFQPRLHVSRTDCDKIPAEFGAKGAIARNGTLYGQAFPVELSGHRYIELHYFHLWTRDCGRVGHKLDAEHVSALLDDGEGGWRALYWYASGHKGTPCDSGNAARALPLAAERNGPHIWASHGKHASFLTLELCNASPCDGDVCRDMIEVPVARVINLGQKGAPLAGAEWVNRREWGLLRSKLGPDFTPVLFARLETLPVEPAKVANVMQPTQAVFLAGSETIGALGTATSHTGSALGTADKKTSNAIRRAWRSTKGFLGGK